MRYLLIGLLFMQSFTLLAQEYFQQQVDYTIKVRLDDKKHFLHATMELDYTNNSPDVLDKIYFHLWPNAFANKKSAFARQQIASNNLKFHYAEASAMGYIDSLDFRVNGEKVSLIYDEKHGDIAHIQLNKPLNAGEKIRISTPFRVKIPDSFSRLGHIKQQYQLTQWYPKPAVYDQEGWHPMPYLSQGEFYSEFGSFEVHISIPENYVVGATGILQNESELQFLDSLATVQIAGREFEEQYPESSKSYKTLIYKQDRVHDFAWFADKTYAVRKGSVQLASGRKVDLYAMYNFKNHPVWVDVLEYMHDAILHYSKYVGEYPYDVMTTIDGALSAGAGMEYPTITVLGASDKLNLEVVTMHEIGHNWFYGILASNERSYPWMDEGMNSYVEMRYMMEKYPEAKMAEMLGLTGERAGKIAEIIGIENLPFRAYYNLVSPILSNTGKDQPNNLPADQFGSINYGGQVYHEIALYFHLLEQYVGHEKMLSAMNRYYEKWKFKHPQPEDVQAAFEAHLGEDLVWLFDDLIGSNKKLKAKIKSVKKEGDVLEIGVKNTGSARMPIGVQSYDKQNQLIDEQWISPKTSSTVLNFDTEGAEYIRIDGEQIAPMMHKQGQYARPDAIFKKSRPLKMQFIGKWENPDKQQLFWVPAIGANTNDRLMLGLSLYNRTVINKPFTYIITPMYSLGRNDVSGFAKLTYTFVSPLSKLIIKPNFHYRRFAGFEKMEPSIQVKFPNPKDGYSPVQSLRLSYSYINNSAQDYPLIPNNYQVLDLRYYWNYDNFMGLFAQPADASIEVGVQSDVFNSFSRAEAYLSYSTQYLEKSAIKWNAYAGFMLQTDDALNPYFQMHLSGSPDIAMDHSFWDRSSQTGYAAILQYQSDARHGGLKSYIPMTANAYLMTSSLSVDMPKLSNLFVWAEGALLEEANAPLFGAGIGLHIIPDIFEIYMPLYGSAFADDLPADGRAIQTNIRFMLKLPQNSVFDLIDRTIR